MSYVVQISVTSILLLCILEPSVGLLKVIIDFDRWEMINGTSVFSMDAVRVRKFNRTLSVLNGTGKLLIDLDDNYEYGFNFARSAQGNNQYNAYPMKLAARPFCEFVRTYYHEYQFLFLNHTNLPYVPAEGLCPFPKGDYWVKDLAVDSSVIPLVVPEGFWRVTPVLRELATGEVIATGSFYAKLTKELT
ncbi:hypothetical protein ZHAS_00005645 [Anopheles sinensis]|uniref:Uncharacterized protein n=1 Tax=Anopheles sinensis TaxID=74873 RepID=A0A084VK12_ANOSI|nr:hypothetical protein ZHAS_00005645 [Anopheles sinensis]